VKALNIVDKIWLQHVVHQESGHPAIFAIDFALLHEVTSPQAFAELDKRQLPVYKPEHFLATIDHSVPTNSDRKNIKDLTARKQVTLLEENVKKHGIPFYGFGSQHQGIVHVIGPELGATQPGMTIVCGDSHTSTHGAFGAMAFGIGTSVLSHVLATGCLLLHKPKVMKVQFNGHFAEGVYAKDAILKLIAKIGIAGATGYAIEYCGEAVHAMTMEERMTLCNMSIECGARAGLVAPDKMTFDYLHDKPMAPKGNAWQTAVKRWQVLKSDQGCAYDAVVEIDLNTLQPMITWGTNPAQAMGIHDCVPRIEDLPVKEQAMAKQALAYVHLQENQPIQGVSLDWAFVGSCTNGRIEDLQVVARVLKGHHVAPNVTFYIVPGSEAVLAQARAQNLDVIFKEAGADFRMPGCSMCIAMNEDKVPAGKRCISSTNRNFVGRQGPGSITHLASPATVAASAIAGKIVSSRKRGS
jgi:3-isopropylmalate/(R)-2-methylmalate dehydratase large subunit